MRPLRRLPAPQAPINITRPLSLRAATLGFWPILRAGGRPLHELCFYQRELT